MTNFSQMGSRIVAPAVGVVNRFQEDDATKRDEEAKLRRQKILDDRYNENQNYQRGRNALSDKRFDDKTKALKEQEDALSSVLASQEDATKNGFRQENTPVIVGNENQITEYNKYNTALSKKRKEFNSEMESASERYSRIFAEGKQILGEPIAPQNRGPLESQRFDYKTAGNEQFGSIRDALNEYPNAKEPEARDKITDKQREVAHLRAMKTSRLDTVLAKQNALGKEKTIPESQKYVPAGTKKVPYKKQLSGSEKAAQLRQAIMNNKTLSGSNKLKALGDISKLYPSQSVTISEQLALSKYEKSFIDDKNTLAAYRTAYENMPKTITTKAGAKAWADKQEFDLKRADKFKGSGDDFKAKLYTNLTSKDYGDIDDVTDFLKENKSQLDAMSKPEKKALYAMLEARYSNESSWLDLTDYLGGSAFGDVADGISFK